MSLQQSSKGLPNTSSVDTSKYDHTESDPAFKAFQKIKQAYDKPEAKSQMSVYDNKINKESKSKTGSSLMKNTDETL